MVERLELFEVLRQGAEISMNCFKFFNVSSTLLKMLLCSDNSRLILPLMGCLVFVSEVSLPLLKLILLKQREELFWFVYNLFTWWNEPVRVEYSNPIKPLNVVN